MAELLDAHEIRLGRRLDAHRQAVAALGLHRSPAVVVAQPRTPDPLPATQSFAASAPGAVALNAASSGEVRIRLERWSARPAEADGAWTDRDELPWQEVVDGGPLTFGKDDTGGLDVDGLGRARVVVHAVTDRAGSRGAEQWLLQLFPDPDHLDAMAGPPRVLSGDPFGRPALPATATAEAAEDSAYERGLEAVRAGGWQQIRHLGLSDLLTLVGIATVPMTRDELMQGMVFFGGSPITSWDDVVYAPDRPNPRWPGEDLADVSQLAGALAAAAGMDAIRTAGDSLECLLRLGVLTEEEGADGLLRIAPSVAAPPAWDAVRLSPAWLLTLCVSTLQRAYGTPRDDLVHLMRWAPDGLLSATLGQIGERLALTPDHVRATAAMMSTGPLTTERNLAAIDDDTPIDARLAGWTAPSGIVPPKVDSIDHATLVGLTEEFLSPDEATAWLAHERPSARLVRVGSGQPVTAVLGGLPQLPDDVNWPTFRGVPLHFLAAVDLAAVHEALPDAPLPASGWLSFFATYDTGPGDELPFVSAMFPASRPGWRVVYVPLGTATTERACPDVEHESPVVAFARVDCALIAEATVPAPHAFPASRDIEFDSERMQALLTAKWQRRDRSRGPDHRVGGWADPAQSDPAAPVALAHAGLVDAAGRVDYKHPRAGELVASADDDWFLLLQLATDDDAGWMWGDGGVMFFYVQPDAARAGDFSDAWMNWDCH